MAAITSAASGALQTIAPSPQDVAMMDQAATPPTALRQPELGVASAAEITPPVRDPRATSNMALLGLCCNTCRDHRPRTVVAGTACSNDAWKRLATHKCCALTGVPACNTALPVRNAWRCRRLSALFVS